MRTHAVAKLFPLLEEDELQELANDIEDNGLQHPIVVQDDVLLDGRNRLAACKMVGITPRFKQYNGKSPVAFIVSMNLKRRNLSAGQKSAIGTEIEPHFAKEAKKRQGMNSGFAHVREKVPQHEKARSRDLAAQIVGVSGKTLSQTKAIKKTSPKHFELIRQGKITVAKARKEIKAANDRKALIAAQKSIAEKKRKHFESVCDLRVMSCKKLFATGIKPNAVITDPPYSKKYLSAFSELSLACKNVPLVAVMVGQSYLPEVMERLCKHLTYRWVLAYLTPGGQAVQQWKEKVNTFWKPILLFGKSKDWFGDVCRSEANDNDKRFHKWGQSESGMADIVKRLTKPKDLVCDPFLGAGATAVASLTLGRKFVGCDIDAKSVEQSKQRSILCVK